METLEIEMNGIRLNVTGESETVKSASKEFYDFLAAKEQCNFSALTSLELLPTTETVEYNEGRSATLRAIRTSATSWEQIARENKNGDELDIGDKVDFTLKSGEQVTVVVTDNTDEYIRFESVDCVCGESVQWNKENITDGGIEESNVQEWLNFKLFGQLPDDLKQAISKVKRKYKDNEGKLKEYETLLFLPAASEVFDEDDCYGDEDIYEQLDYYKDRRNRMRGAAKGEDTVWYWLASVSSGNSTAVCSVGSYGYAGYGNTFGDGRVPFCFCISKSYGE